MKILVIEDNPDIKEVLDYILQDDGHEVVTCVDGTSINELDRIMPDMILMDEILAGPRGSALCLQLKSNEATRHIPVVLISATPNLQSTAENAVQTLILKSPSTLMP